MKAWFAHAVFAALVVGSLSTRMKTPDALSRAVDLEPAVFRIAQLHGLIFHSFLPVADTGRHALVFEAPGCAKPLRVFVRELNLAEEPFTQIAPEPDYSRRYVYVDKSWDRPDHLAVRVQQVKYELLSTLGQTQYLPGRELLQLELPPHCRAIEAIDWRMVWSRAYL
jgi:hypothetical protein